MDRKYLFIPLDEVRKQLLVNERQSIKIVVPKQLTAHLFNYLKKHGIMVKQEQPLTKENWTHSKINSSNYICESSEFGHTDDLGISQGPFAVSFANEQAHQEMHFHKAHWEIYYSESPIGATYKMLDDRDLGTVHLKEGGLIVFGPDVVHQMELTGLTCIIEYPAVVDDKIRLNDVD